MAYANTYYTNFTKFLSDKMIEEALPLLPPERQSRIQQAERIETKASLVASGLLVQKVLKEYFHIETPVFDVMSYGKPYLANIIGLHFNLSHSGTYAICTVADMECGCDIEKITQPHQIYAMANRFFTKSECEMIKIAAEPKETFAKLWTLRESYVKMRGTGFHTPLATLNCRFENGTCIMFENLVAQNDASFKEFRDIKDYRIAVCTKGDAVHKIKEIIL